jgi:hypothetical protein
VVSRVAEKYRVPKIVPWLGILFLAVLFFSLVMFYNQDTKIRRKVFFFPQYRSSKVTGESRNLPVRGSMEENIELLIREILLGPVDVTHVHIFPEGTMLRTVMLRDMRLYIDLSVDAILGRKKSELGFEESVDVLKRTISYNFPSIESFLVTIDGELPSTLLPE